MFKKIVLPIFNPDRFQGKGKTKNYFEGWYFKIVNEPGDAAFAIIPGIAMDKNGKGHAFIQILDGKARLASYHKFDLNLFEADSHRFGVRIGNNFFSEEAMILDGLELSGKLQFSNQVKWPSHWYSPGIMGPFSFVPFMECYHGIVSMGHTIQGSLQYRNQSILFDGGKGYIEKDWGRSFPSGYVWMQSNHFNKNEELRFKLSVARIPWITGEFTGFIAGLYDGQKLIRFTTYNRCKLLSLSIDQHEVNAVIEHPSYLLKVRAVKEEGTLLASPILGFMDGRIEESMTSSVSIELFDRQNRLIISDSGKHAGLEIAGKTDLIVKQSKLK